MSAECQARRRPGGERWCDHHECRNLPSDHRL